MDEIRIPPACDLFTAKPAPRHDEHVAAPAPHGCYEGVVYIGHLEMTEEGEEV